MTTLGRIVLSPLLPGLVLLAACTDQGQKDTGISTGDADTDSDSDTDTDTDTTDTNTTNTTDTTDSDSGTTATVGETFSGTLTYKYVSENATICDADITLTGTPYTGDCLGCVFAFDMSTVVSRDDGSDDCEYPPLLTWVPDAAPVEVEHLLMAYWNTYDHGYYETYPLTGAFGLGYDYPGDDDFWSWGAAEGPYGHLGGTFLLNGYDLSWTWDADLQSYEYSLRADYYQACVEVPRSAETADLPGASMDQESGCRDDFGDVWVLQATAGDVVTASVDTVAEESAADLYFWVTDPDGCTVIYADDNFSCAVEPPLAPGASCPSASFTATTTGDYRLYVGPVLGTCTGSRLGYILSLDGATSTFENDDTSFLDKSAVNYHQSVTMTGAISP